MSEGLFLAIETSTRVGSVALGDGGQPLSTRVLSPDQRHTSGLMPAIADMLSEKNHRLTDVTTLCFSHGPGSFTGLRVAATVGRMMQSAVGCSVVAVPTLATIARNALHHPDRPLRVVAMLDAKRDQVYAAVFERDRVGDEFAVSREAGVHDPAALLRTIAAPFAVMGDGVRKYKDICRSSGAAILDGSTWQPSAEHVLAIGCQLAAAGRFCKPDEITPLYLRPPECEEVYEQRRAAARERRGE